MNIKSKDTIKWDGGVAPELIHYKGIVTWIDFHTRELGVALLAPKAMRGGYKVIRLDTEGLTVTESFTPATFKQNLSDISTDELRAEIEEIRLSRKGMGKLVTKRRGGRVPKAPVSPAMKAVAKLSAADLDKILNEGK